VGQALACQLIFILDIMTRRELFSSFLVSGAAGALAFPARSAAQASFPGTPFHAYSRCLPDYLRGLAKQAVEKRDAELAKLVTQAAIDARQNWVRETLWKLIGGMPERTALNARTTGSLEREHYRVDKVIYESQPNLFVSANLYVPKQGDGPFPAVLFQMGHTDDGRFHPNYQRCCQGLVQLGFVVLAFDPMGEGERIEYPDSSGTHTRLQDTDSEHTVPGKQMLLFGDTATRFQLWDAVRSLDYLLSLPIVDPKRVGTTGHSGGGTLTMLLSGADQRLAAAAVCMGNTENLAAIPFVSPGSTDDAEQDLIDAGPAGFDRWDLFYSFAPRPMLIWPSDRDFYATYSSEYIKNGWQEFQKLQKTYSTLKHADRLKWADTPLPHSLAYDSRMLVYNWFRRWLQGSAEPVHEEPPVNPEAAAVLRATESGNVVHSLHSATAFTLNKSRQVQRTPVPLDELLRVSRFPSTSKIISRQQTPRLAIEVLEVRPDAAVWLPAWLLTAKDTAPDKPVLLVLDTVTAERLWFQPDADLPPGSPVVCAADIRGVGAVAPEFGSGHADYAASHRLEENYAWGSLMLGKPLVGQRVADILAFVAALHQHPATAQRRILVAATQKLTVPALFAAALDKRIDGLYLSGGLTSFSDVVDTEIYSHPFGNFVPGLLNHTDLPEVAASIAPQRIVLAGAVNAKGDTAKVDAVRQLYAGTHITIEPDSKWNVEKLVSFASA
jgi:dienelactone hydrolase